jgi:hypothetical protein
LLLSGLEHYQQGLPAFQACELRRSQAVHRTAAANAGDRRKCRRRAGAEFGLLFND